VATAIGSITRASTRKSGKPLNILTAPTHERYESCLARTGHSFYAIRGKELKDWDFRFASLPSNYTLLDKTLGEKQIPVDLDFDLVLSQNKHGQFGVLSAIAEKLHLPLISLEHVLPHEKTGPGAMATLRQMRGDINVFISQYSLEKWGWKDDPTAVVIHHGVDTEVFAEGEWPRERRLLSVVNQWESRDYFCGYKFWKDATEGLPIKVFGDNPGLSSPASSIGELAQGYKTSQIFVNTSMVSPIPTALLEAMACGCAVISTATCMIPEVIENQVNGILVNSPDELRQEAERLLANPMVCESLGREARKTIEERFSLTSFVEKWNEVFARASQMVYRGAA
jgi:hypothetical protein